MSGGINYENCRHFFKISPFWKQRDQKYLAALGLELDICYNSYHTLYNFCLSKIDHSREKWPFTQAEVSDLVISCRAFIDHGVRIPKIVSIFTKEGKIYRKSLQVTEENNDLRLLRNALHHSDERLENLEQDDSFIPITGDFSWSCWSSENTLDTYFTKFGPFITETETGPETVAGGTIRMPIDRITYRAYNISVDLTQCFFRIVDLIDAMHEEIATNFREFCEKLPESEKDKADDFLPSLMHGKYSVGGLVLGSPSSEGGNTE